MRQALPLVDMRRALGISADAAAPVGLDDLPANARIVIDHRFSALEAAVLLRFLATEGVVERHVDGLSGMGDLARLVPGIRFSPNDQPLGDEQVEALRALPLASILSLPQAPAPIAGAIPYIRASKARREIWERSLADLPRPLIGVAWDESRPGILLDDLMPVLRGTKGSLIGLAWDHSRGQMHAWPELIDAGRHFSSLSDLAALVQEMDMVIGPDGLPMHFAGAMGRSGLLLTQPNPAWYWHAGEERSLWYPSVKVLRTKAFGNWALRIEDIAGDIKASLAANGIAAGE
jgi:hypothetical protein